MCRNTCAMTLSRLRGTANSEIVRTKACIRDFEIYMADVDTVMCDMFSLVIIRTNFFIRVLRKELKGNPSIAQL